MCRLQSFEPQSVDSLWKKGNCDVTGFDIRHVFADTRQSRARSPDTKRLLWQLCSDIIKNKKIASSKRKKYFALVSYWLLIFILYSWLVIFPHVGVSGTLFTTTWLDVLLFHVNNAKYRNLHYVFNIWNSCDTYNKAQSCIQYTVC